MSSGHWYQYATTSNRIKQTYVNGFLDISGDLVVRNNNFSINGLISQNTDTAATNAQYTYISWNDVSGTFATVGNPTFSNNITVNENTKTATLSVTGDSSLNKLFLNGNLAVGKTDVTSGTTLDVSGVALVSSKLSINNATYASMTNSSNNTRVLVTGDSTGTNADVSGQVVLTGSTDTNSRLGIMLDTTTTNFPIGKIQVNQTNVGGGQRLALNPAGGKVGVATVPDASGTQLDVAGGIASKEPTTGNAGVGTFVKTMSAANWYKLAQCGDTDQKVTFRVVGLVTYLNNSYNIDVTTTYNSGATAPISSILLNNTIGSNVFTDANIDFVVVYDSDNDTSSYYIKCNSNAVYCALTIYVTAKTSNGTYSKLRFYQDAVFALAYANAISNTIDAELSGTITQFVISTHANTTYPMVVSSTGNVGIKNNNPAFALDVSGTSNIGLTNGGVGLFLNSYSSTSGPYLSLKHNGTNGKDWRIGSTGSVNTGGAGLLQFFDATAGSGGWQLQIGSAGGINVKQPQYRDATMSLANTFTKSGIKITGDAHEADGLCMGLWGTPTGQATGAGDNGTGYIQNIWDTQATPLARDLLLNPLGGNVAIGKTTAGVALDVTGDVKISGYLNTTGPTNAISTIVSLTSGTSWTIPTGVFRCKVTCIGGGGGGGGASNLNKGGGGGGGGLAIKVFNNLTPGSTATYSIGAGGAGSTGNTGTAGIGGTTSFTWNGTTITANGGGRGTSFSNTVANGTLNAPAAGGTATGGDINISGERGGVGENGINFATGSTSKGGNSPLGYGFGGPDPISNSGTGSVGTSGAGYGGGGSGGYGSASNAGGAGTDGIIIIEY